MKTRNGFVSNSSSTSFTCDVCGEEASGMDLSRSDAGMQECENGHTFCESHALNPDLSDDEIRKILIDAKEQHRGKSWVKAEELDAEIAEIREMNEYVLEEAFDEYNNEDGCVPDYCPICQMQEMDDSDVIRYAFIKLGIKNRKALAKELKAEFGTYDKFLEWMKQNQKTESKA